MVLCFLFRYMAICRPLTVPFRRLSKMSRASWALVAIWISSVLFSLPWLYYNKVRLSIILTKFPLCSFVIHYMHIRMFKNIFPKVQSITLKPKVSYPISHLVFIFRSNLTKVEELKHHLRLRDESFGYPAKQHFCVCCREQS